MEGWGELGLKSLWVFFCSRDGVMVLSPTLRKPLSHRPPHNLLLPLGVGGGWSLVGLWGPGCGGCLAGGGWTGRGGVGCAGGGLAKGGKGTGSLKCWRPDAVLYGGSMIIPA